MSIETGDSVEAEAGGVNVAPGATASLAGAQVQVGAGSAEGGVGGRVALAAGAGTRASGGSVAAKAGDAGAEAQAGTSGGKVRAWIRETRRDETGRDAPRRNAQILYFNALVLRIRTGLKHPGKRD